MGRKGTQDSHCNLLDWVRRLMESDGKVKRREVLRCKKKNADVTDLRGELCWVDARDMHVDGGDALS